MDIASRFRAMVKEVKGLWLPAAVLLPLLLVAQAASILTSSYSDPSWQQLAGKYRANLERTHKDIAGSYRADQVHFLVAGESTVGGVGFWASPFVFGDPNRYLCVFARVRCPDPSSGRPFPDTQVGRIMTIMDAYGKNSIGVLARELKSMPDPQIVGAAMIFIYDRKPVTDPGFEQNAEAMAIFMPRDSVLRFAELRMTLQSLFSQSEMLPVFQGAEQINNLRLYIIQP